MRTPAILRVLAADCCSATTISACSRSRPVGAPSSQSIVMSKIAAELLLQLEGLVDQLLAAGEVLAGRDDGERSLALEQSLLGKDRHVPC